MASKPNKRGSCGNCGYLLLRRYRKDPKRIMIAASPVVDSDGNTMYICHKCKTETDIPEIKIKRKVRIANANKAAIQGVTA